MWGSEENDEDLARALEESRRLYEEFERPRLSQLQSDNSNFVTDPSRSKASFDPGPSTSRETVTSFTAPISNNDKNIHSTENNEERGSNDQTDLYDGPEAEGFCFSEGRQWVYPTSDKFPVRLYQKSIVEKALFNNTLVSLPTGLGKTFIAAVVMYNFYRWYPKGKFIFMAPTKPLVAQQQTNCCEMGIPHSQTAQMTGAMPAKERTSMWQDKRVFFLTPQIVQNDLSTGICPAHSIKCIVIDEAHRAVGDYAYTMVIKALNSFEVHYRVLALSATPGSDLQAVQNVISNLMINHIELRNEQSPDLIQYTHQRNVETMVVQVGPTIQRIQEKYLQIIQSYTTRLQQRKVLFGNVKTMTRFGCLKQWQEFRSEASRNMDAATVSQLNCDFSVVCTLLHGLELLQTYGLRLLLNHLKGAMNNKGTDPAANRLAVNEEISTLLEEIVVILNPINLHDDETKEPSKTQIIYGHPKLDRLQQVVVSHFEKFKQAGQSTRVIIFCEYREGVLEISDMLKNFEPLVKPVIFMGQASGKTSKGISQKQQLEIMKQFRNGSYNTLVSTSVGEEGLDIGEVDLIICFDAKNSPIRQVQRMGRTGRKREGRIIMLITQGKEERKYRESVWKKNNVNSALLSVEHLSGFLYDDCPRMLPPGVEPKCVEQAIKVVPNKVTPVQQDLRKMLMKRPSSAGGKASSTSGKYTSKSSLLSEEDMLSLSDFNVQNFCEFNHIPAREEMWKRLKDDTSTTYYDSPKCLDLSYYLEYQRFEQRTHIVGNSSNTNMLCYLLDWAENRRDREQGTQCAVFARGTTSTQIWPKKGKKRSRGTAEISDPNEEKSAKMRKRGRSKKVRVDPMPHIEKHTPPESPPELLSEEFVKPKRPQFIEDEDDPIVIDTSPLKTKHETQSIPDSPGLERQPHSDCDEDNEEPSISSPLFGSQLSRKNLMLSLLSTLDRQLNAETDVCDICENLFPCESISNLVSSEPVKELSWGKVRSSLQAAVNILPTITRDDLENLSGGKPKQFSEKERFVSLIPIDDGIYCDDFVGGILCGGVGDYSPPYESRISDLNAKLISQSERVSSHSRFNEHDEEIDLLPDKKHSPSCVWDNIHAKENVNPNYQSTGKEIVVGDSIIEEHQKKEKLSISKADEDTSSQHLMNDTLDFLGLSKLEDIFETPSMISATRRSCEKKSSTPDLLDKSLSNEKNLSTKRYLSPTRENTSDSSQVSPILGSQVRRRFRSKVRKLCLGPSEQEVEKTNLHPETIKQEVKEVQSSSTVVPMMCVPTPSRTSPVCDFNICDEGIFDSSPESDHYVSKTTKIDESIKEAVRLKALEIMSKPRRSLTQQIRDMCDTSSDGFTQVLGFLDSKSSVSPNCKVARADSSTSLENENLDNVVDGVQPGSPDLFGDYDFHFDENPENSSFSTKTSFISHGFEQLEDKHNSAQSISKCGQVTPLREKQTSGKNLEVKEEKVEEVSRCPSPVFSQNIAVKKPSKLSLKNRKKNHQMKSETQNSQERSIDLPSLNRVKEEMGNTLVVQKLINNVSQFDVGFFGDEFNNSWSCSLNEAVCEKFSPKPNLQVSNTTKVDSTDTSLVILQNDLKVEEVHSNTELNKVTVSSDCGKIKNDFDVAFEKLDALRKNTNTKKLSLSRGISNWNNKKAEVKLQPEVKPQAQAKPQPAVELKHPSKFALGTKIETVNLLSSDDDSPVKPLPRRKNTNLNMTSSSEEGHSILCDKRTKDMEKESPLFVAKRRKGRLDSSSSNDDFQENRWLCAKKQSRQQKEQEQHFNAVENEENSFLDLTTFCDDSILSPLKDLKADAKENEFKRNLETKTKKHKKKKKSKSTKRCAFLESEAEESGDGLRNSSDGESTSLDEMDSSFINDSQPDGSQSEVIDMHAKYLQSVKSPARGGGGFKIPKNINPKITDVYSQLPDTSELDQHYAIDSFCVDDEPTQYEDNDMSLLEIAEARLKARRKEKRKQRRKNILNADPTIQEETESGSSSEGDAEYLNVRRKPNQRRRRIIVADSDSEELEGDKPIVNKNVEIECSFNSKNVQKPIFNIEPTKCVEDPNRKDNEFAKLLEDDEDLFFDDDNFRTFCESSSSAAIQMSTSSPIRPSKFVMKSRVVMGQAANELTTGSKISHPSIPLSGPSKCPVFKTPQSPTIIPKNLTSTVKCTNPASSSLTPQVPPSSKAASLVIIVSSRQVASYPDLARLLRVTHHITISPRSMSYVDFIVSYRLGVIRTFVSELRDRKRVHTVTKALKEYFCKPVLIIERDRVKSLGGPYRSKKMKTSDEGPTQKALWTSTNCNTIALLRQAGINLLFAQDKDETAGLIAKLANKETVKGYGIPELPLNLSDDVENRLQFFSSLPCVNFALAVKLLVTFPSIAQFLLSCTSVLDIASATGLDVAAARKIHNLLCEVHVNP